MRFDAMPAEMPNPPEPTCQKLFRLGNLLRDDHFGHFSALVELSL